LLSLSQTFAWTDANARRPDKEDGNAGQDSRHMGENGQPKEEFQPLVIHANGNMYSEIQFYLSVMILILSQSLRVKCKE
jgi:hypothetical protein